jgi:hypothetical protein
LIVVAQPKRTDGGPKGEAVPKGDVALHFDMESLLPEEVKTVKTSYTCIPFRGAIFYFDNCDIPFVVYGF